MNPFRFFDLNGEEKRLFLEAAYETLSARIVTTVCGMRRYAPRLGQNGTETETIEFDPERKDRVLRIKAALARCRHLIWARKCLAESVAAKRMLDRRGIPATLYLGVAKDDKGKMTAHAWLRSGNVWVTGGRNRHKFTVVGFFS